MNSAFHFSDHSVKLARALLTIFALTWHAAKADDAFKPLFDGHSFHGWEQHGGKAHYAIEDGIIVGTSVVGSGNSFLCTTQEFGDFILELEVKADAGLNSGIQIRSHCFDHPTTFVKDGKTNTIAAGRVHGYQVEVDHNTGRRWSGGLYEEARRGWLHNLENDPVAQQAYKFGDWNKYRIQCSGSSIKVWVNDVLTTDLQDSETPKGFIALQVHGTDKAGLQVRFRNIRIQVLDRLENSSKQ